MKCLDCGCHLDEIEFEDMTDENGEISYEECPRCGGNVDGRADDAYAGAPGFEDY